MEIWQRGGGGGHFCFTTKFLYPWGALWAKCDGSARPHLACGSEVEHHWCRQILKIVA